LGYLFGTAGQPLVCAGDGCSFLPGQIFNVFNMGILIFACFFLSYIMAMSAFSSDSSHSMLHRKFMSPWIPIRAVSGIAFLIPTNSGYSLLQLMIIKIVLLGWMMDTLLLQNNLISFSSPYTSPFSLIQPYWMTCLWFALGATINHSLSWLKKTKAWSTVFGLAFGTLSYLAGSRFGVIHFESNLGILFTALAWALLIPLFVLISQCQSLELSQSKSN
jgi:hypothetical protein